MLAILSSAIAIAVTTPSAYTPNKPSEGCRLSLDRTGRPAVPPPFNGGLLHKLTDLPDADEEILVNRTVGGCPLPVTVVRNVSSGSR